MAAEPSAAHVPAPPVNDSASTNSLIQQIAAEARASGQSLFHDPDAAVVDDQGVPVKAGKGAKAGKGKGKDADRATGEDGEGGALESADDAESDGDDPTDPDAADDAGDGDEDSGDDSADVGELNVEAIQAALTAEGGVDVEALATALGVTTEALKISPAQYKAARLERKKAQQAEKRAEDLTTKLEQRYGDQVKARKAAELGELEPAIEFIEATFGRGWNEVNKMVGALLEGKPVPDMEDKRQLREYKKREQEQQAAAKKAQEESAANEKVEQAKTWITTQIKADKLASPEMSKLLKDAGLPTLTELVFEEMQKGYSKGLTDPKKALEKVREKLKRQAKALASAGLIAAPTPPKRPVSTSPPRKGAQAGAAGNSRKMTDAEMRHAVLREAGIATK